ncbi:hypothetical protein ACDP63_16900 [Paracoccus sp. P2]|uniref:hypothetical protein n=1 Tax=Paracoccus sp. P2 TaxID=3248840 RepID=UPI00391EF27D
MKSDLVDLTLQIHARTERAILVSDDGDREKAVWLPLPHIEVAPRGRHHVVTMPEWLAIDRGLV